MSSTIKTLEDEITQLEKTLQEKKSLLKQMKCRNASGNSDFTGLTTDEVVRYSRQMIMPQFTQTGQLALKGGKVLIVGAGGLGCPAAQYLAAAGVGEIHILDFDDIELSNLHRQVLHYERNLGCSKAKSVCEKITSLNGNIKAIPIQKQATSKIENLLKENGYHVILDCTDNAPTRYLLNDLCVFQNIPLVSGSALQLEGQLTVYNYKNGPCYRCLFPTPPPPHTVTNCGDGGVLGPGVIGVLQALETIKILTKMDGVLSGRLLLFDGSTTLFRNIVLRKKKPECEVCGENPKITSPIDYELFCGARAHDKVINIDILQTNEHVDVDRLDHILQENGIVIDVRPKLEYEMCNLHNTYNLPYSDIQTENGLKILHDIIQKNKNEDKNVYFLCRRGNDSQRTVTYLQNNYKGQSLTFLNVRGGLHNYANCVDPTFPVY